MTASRINIRIENKKTALLEVCNSLNNLAVTQVSPDTFRIVFRENPLYEIEYSLVNERLFIETFQGRDGFGNGHLSFSEEIESWLGDTCCDDFSVFSHLPDGRYMLVKTGRKPEFKGSILLGNTWVEPDRNILCFEGSENNEIYPLLKNSISRLKKHFYSIIVGNMAGLAPAVNRPLLSVIIPDYGIVWEGATGFIFLSFEKAGEYTAPEKDMLLVVPLCGDFIIPCPYNSDKTASDIHEDIESFINLI